MINNVPVENEWHLQDNDINSANYRIKYKFCFEEFKAEDIRMLIKSYVWQNHQTGAAALSSIYAHYTGFKKFNLFALQNDINSLADFDTSDADNFMTFLKLSISKHTGKPFSYSAQAGAFATLKLIIYWGQVFAHELVPAQKVFVGNEYPGVGAEHKIDYIPDDVVKQINKALLIEENPYVKYGLIILLSTGMRLSELLNLEVGCVTPHLLNGDTLTKYDFKNRRQHRKIPINPICAHAIAEIERISAPYREKADERIKKFLFIYKVDAINFGGKIGHLKREPFVKWINGQARDGRYYPGFMDRHNITGSDGKIYKVKIHQFRKTVATDMFSKNVDMKVIQEFLCHADSKTTRKYYADGKNINRAMVFEKVGIIGNINNIDTSVIADENELVWFKENKDKGAKMCDGYCTMPIINGKICEKLLNHQKCYTCSRYITTPEYLQAHKDYLDELESQLANNIYGVHYAAHLTPTIAVLKDIIERLEAIEHDS